MQGVQKKAFDFLGKLQYNKWVLVTRYKQATENSGTQVFNVAFLGMGLAILIDNHSRKQNAANAAYNLRKQNVAAHDKKMLGFQRQFAELNIDELEKSVYRVRTGKAETAAKTAKGEAYVPTAFPIFPASGSLEDKAEVRAKAGKSINKDAIKAKFAENLTKQGTTGEQAAALKAELDASLAKLK